MKTFRLGIFVVGTLAILTGAIFLIGSRQFRFRSTYSVKAQFENAGGLEEGAGVRVGGIHMGTVRDIELPRTPDGKITVRMDLEAKTRDVVKKDSVASIQAEGLIGDEYIEVSFGSKDAPAIRNGDEIAGQAPLQMSALIQKADGILDQLQGSAKDMQEISGKINSGTGTVGALINDKSLYNRVNAGAAEFQSDAQALQHNFLLRGFFKNRGYDDASELSKNEIRQLPQEAYSKEFTLESKGLFDKPDTAKLKDDKALKPVGDFLQSKPFGLAVVAALGAPMGDTAKENQLTLARAAVVRDYLVNHYRLDDTRIKTIGLPKRGQSDNGEVQIMVYAKATPPATGGGR
jgi:phospholipid/cholesterol/gamma-HCH transport system substrate-binding protein